MALKIGALYELDEIIEFCPITIVDNEVVYEHPTNNVYFEKGAIVTVLFYEKEEHSYANGDLFYWNIIHILWGGRIWYTDFNGASPRMKEVECE